MKMVTTIAMIIGLMATMSTTAAQETREVSTVISVDLSIHLPKAGRLERRRK